MPQNQTTPSVPAVKRRLLPQRLWAPILTALVLSAEASTGFGQGESLKDTVATSTDNLESKWGIQIESLRLSARGYMIDFRYKVVDPQKAAALGDPKAKPYLVDQATGTKMFVPRSPKVGPLRQSAVNLAAGKVYFAFFSNRNQVVKPGSKVTVVIGDFKAENLAVQ